MRLSNTNSNLYLTNMQLVWKNRWEKKASLSMKLRFRTKLKFNWSCSGSVMMLKQLTKSIISNYGLALSSQITVSNTKSWLSMPESPRTTLRLRSTRTSLLPAGTSNRNLVFWSARWIKLRPNYWCRFIWIPSSYSCLALRKTCLWTRVKKRTQIVKR